jgi:hypothetical protein
MKLVFIFLLALSSMTVQAQEPILTDPPIEQFQRVLTNKKGKTAMFTIKSYNEEQIVTLKNGKEIIIQMSELSAADQAFFQRKLKARKPIEESNPFDEEEEQSAVDATVVDRSFFIGEWEIKAGANAHRRIFNDDGTSEVWINRKREYKQHGYSMIGLTWKMDKNGLVTVLDKEGRIRRQYIVSDKNKPSIEQYKSKHVLTKAVETWKEPTTGDLVYKDGKLRRKPAGASFSRVVELSSLGSEKLPRIVISDLLQNRGKAYHTPDGTLLIQGTRSMKLRVVDVMDENNNERKGLEVTDTNLKKIIDDEGKAIVEFSSEQPSWQVKIYDDQGELTTSSRVEVFPQYSLFHHPDGKKVKVFGWICHNIASPDGLSVYKGSKYGWLGYDGKLLIPPLYKAPIKYLGNKIYEAEINGETKTITLP